MVFEERRVFRRQKHIKHYPVNLTTNLIYFGLFLIHLHKSEEFVVQLKLQNFVFARLKNSVPTETALKRLVVLASEYLVGDCKLQNSVVDHVGESAQDQISYLLRLFNQKNLLK